MVFGRTTHDHRITTENKTTIEGSKATSTLHVNNSRNVTINKTTDMSLFLAGMAMNVAIPVIVGLIEKAINKWNDDIPDSMAEEAHNDYDLIKSKIDGFVESTGGHIDVDISRPLEFSCADFFNLQIFFEKYSESIFVNAMNTIIRGFVDQDRNKVKEGEQMLSSCQSKFSHSIRFSNDHSFNAVKMGGKFEEALDCIARMMPSNRMPKPYEIIAYSPSPVYHLNCTEQSISFLKEKLGHLYDVESQFSESAYVVKLVPKKTFITVSDLSVVYSTDISRLTVGQFFGRMDESSFLASDHNISREAILKSMVGHSLIKLREVIQETKLTMISSMSGYRNIEDITNIYRRCEYGPFLSNISMSDFTKFTTIFEDITNKTMGILEKDFKVMTSLIQICAMKNRLFPNLRSQSEDMIEDFVISRSNLYDPEPLSVATNLSSQRLYPSPVPYVQSIEAPLNELPPRFTDETPTVDNLNVEDSNDCLSKCIKSLLDIDLLNRSVKRICDIDPITFDAIKNKLTRKKGVNCLISVKFGKNVNHCAPTFSTQTDENLKRRNELMKQIASSEGKMIDHNAFKIMTLGHLFAALEFHEHVFKGFEDRVSRARFELKELELMNTSLDDCSKDSRSVTHDDCLRSVMLISFNTDIGPNKKMLMDIDLALLSKFKVISEGIPDIGNIHLRSYRYSSDDSRNHIEVDDEINKHEEIYRAKRDCEIRVFSLRDFFNDPKLSEYRQTVYFSSIVSDINYLKYAKCIECDLKVEIRVRDDYRINAETNAEFASWLLSRMICDITRLKTNTWKDVVLQYGFSTFSNLTSDIRGSLAVVLSIIDTYAIARDNSELKILEMTSKVFKSKKKEGESLICLTMKIIDANGRPQNVFDCVEQCDVEEIDYRTIEFKESLGIVPACSRLCPDKLHYLYKHGLNPMIVSKQIRETGFKHSFTSTRY
jgi:hypothetical protein